jgi:hypothetical protein
MRIPLALLVAFSLTFALSGCNSTANHSDKPAANKPDHDHEEHDHAHHGPHEGHIAAVGDEEYHVEWVHDDATGKVTLYVVDAAAKKEVPISAPEIVVVTKHGSDEPKEYTLTAVDPQEGKSAQFEVMDKELLGTMETLSKDITATVKQLEINGKTFDNVLLTMDHHH